MLRLARQSTSRAVSSAARSASSKTIQRRWASGGQAYNEPSGYLFGEKPLPKGEKRQKEGWENLWYWGFGGSIFLGGLMQYYKPDTSITTWAMGEAKKNLEASGKPWKYEPSPYSGHPNGC
ncbi:unnamed protein product [Sympodiomycopsis kandeliae]